jgi:hypothetical protein
LVEKSEGKRPLEVIGGGGMIILDWVLEEWGEKVWSRYFWLRTRNRLL